LYTASPKLRRGAAFIIVPQIPEEPTGRQHTHPQLYDQ
jgi:hypothetical protein